MRGRLIDEPPLLEGQENSPPRAMSADEEFFSSYDWCLNPYQPVRSLLQKLQDEFRRHETADAPFQRQETRVNIYLLVCAMGCAADDYLAWRPSHLTSDVQKRIPRLKGTAGAIDAFVNTVHAHGRAPGDRRLKHWRRELGDCIDLAAETLVYDPIGVPASWSGLEKAARGLCATRLPGGLLDWRLRIPEAFRCQDLSHHDAVALAKRFLRAYPSEQGPVAVIGPRTAGAYFAPLVQAALAAEGVAVRGWMSLRPKLGASRQEKRQARRLIEGAHRILIVDDHPNTGDTLGRMLALLSQLGAQQERIVILAPDHPAQLDWAAALHPVAAVTLPPTEFHKWQILHNAPEIEKLLCDLLEGRGYSDIRIREAAAIENINSRLAARWGETFEVRLKRAFEVRLKAPNGSPTVKRILAKSVGWGWFGYHAYLAGTRLAGFVPPVIGLRQGMLFTEWVGTEAEPEVHPSSESIAAILPAYVAARAKRLALVDGQCFASPADTGAGSTKLLSLLRKPYGPILGKLKTRMLKSELQKLTSPLPCLIDGRISADEWVETASGPCKVDFEHHNFGGAQLDVTDLAYDLASATFELDLSEAAECRIVDAYSSLSGDAAVRGRLLINKILCGVDAMDVASYSAQRAAARGRRDYWNERYNTARDFLTFAINRYSARRLGPMPPAAWSKRLFFLDLDGVFDVESFGPYFPHTTETGLRALGLLKAHGYAVVFNTGRSIRHVRDYCRSYASPGGIAEYGSVFWDAVGQREIPLIDSEAQRQLSLCRTLLEQTPDVFVDPGYRYVLRAFRYNGKVTVEPSPTELQELLDGHRLDRLTYISHGADSYVVQKGVDKGTALQFVRDTLPDTDGPLVAIGDSPQDIPMLERADIAYVPANFPDAYRNQLDCNCRPMRQPEQLGLLAAVQDLTGDRAPGLFAMTVDDDFRCHLIDALLRTAEQPRYRRILGFLASLLGWPS